MFTRARAAAVLLLQRRHLRAAEEIEFEPVWHSATGCRPCGSVHRAGLLRGIATNSSSSSDPPSTCVDQTVNLCSFYSWCELMEALANDPSHTAKQHLIRAHISAHLSTETEMVSDCSSHSNHSAFSNLLLMYRLALAREDSRVYRLRDRSLVRFLGEILTRSDVSSPERSVDVDSELTIAFARDVEHRGDLGEAVLAFAEQAAASRTDLVAGAIAGNNEKWNLAACCPATKPTLSLAEVDAHLSKLATLTRDDEQRTALRDIVRVATPRELKWIVRLIKRDLRIGAQAALFLSALDELSSPPSDSNIPSSSSIVVSRRRAGTAAGTAVVAGTDAAGTVRRKSALEEYRRGADLRTVVGQALRNVAVPVPQHAHDLPVVSDPFPSDNTPRVAQTLADKQPLIPSAYGSEPLPHAVCPGVPIKPQLAEALRDVSAVTAKCAEHPLAAEIKYDGVRVQVHLAPPSAAAVVAAATTNLSENETGGSSCGRYTFFSRSLKPVKGDQVDGIALHLPSAFPRATSMILDGEVLLLAADGTMLAFGSLGTEERKKHVGARPALFVFDVLYFNDESLLDRPWHERRALLAREFSPTANPDVQLSLARVFGDTGQAAHDSEVVGGDAHVIGSDTAAVANHAHDTTTTCAYSGTPPVSVLRASGPLSERGPASTSARLLVGASPNTHCDHKATVAAAVEGDLCNDASRAILAMFNDVVAQGMEGLVLKRCDGVYEPGKRRWFKLKRDLMDTGGGLADSVDLVVLGSYFGRGVYGGQQSVWLLGVRDSDDSAAGQPESGIWKTVAKVGNGMTDAAVDRLNRDVHMTRLLPGDPLPPWLRCTTTLRPHFVVADPSTAPVWQVSGHALTRSKVHSIGLSIRFPRLMRERTDKTAADATGLEELRSAAAAAGAARGGV